MSDTELDDNKSEILDVCEDENMTEDEVDEIPRSLKYFCQYNIVIFLWQAGTEILRSSSSAFSLVRPADKMASPFLPTSSPPGNTNQTSLHIPLSL